MKIHSNIEKSPLEVTAQESAGKRKKSLKQKNAEVGEG